MKKNKRCPRCNFKVDAGCKVCPSCRLNYDKLDLATNSEAKKALAEKDKDRVVYAQGCPTDIKKWKLLLIAIFLGFCGGHHFYTGRKGWGIFYFVFFVAGITDALVMFINKFEPRGDWYQIFYLFVLVWGVVLTLWLIDIVKIIFNKFKVPVSLPR